MLQLDHKRAKLAVGRAEEGRLQDMRDGRKAQRAKRDQRQQMVLTKSLSDRIAVCYDDLSKRERMLADTVLACAGDLAGYTATELANAAKVSKATATRFFRRLGYQDYEGVRLEARRTPYWGSPLEAFYAVSNQQSQDEVSKHVKREIENIAETFNPSIAEGIEASVKRLVSTDRIWMLGFRDNYPIAAYAAVTLARVKDVRLLPSLGMSLAEDIADITRKDVVLAIGFRRWPKVFPDVLRLIRKAGASIILVTDVVSSISPAAADVFLRCHIKGSSIFDSHTAGISLINLLSSRVARALGKTTRSRLEKVEQLHSELGDFQPERKRGKLSGGLA